MFCCEQLVESVLSKVVEEFEHRIASQYDLVFYFFIPKRFYYYCKNLCMVVIFSPIQCG